MAQTVRIQVFEVKVSEAHHLERMVNEFIYSRERQGLGIEDVQIKFFEGEGKLGAIVSYKSKQL